MNEDITIDLKDLCYRILLRWRIILVFCIAGALLGNCVGIFKDYRALNAARSVDSAAKTEAEKQNLESLRAAISAREAGEVDAAVATYRTLRTRFDDLSSYVENSILYNLDSGKVPTYSIHYQVKSGYEAVYPTIASRDYAPDLAHIVAASLGDPGLVSAVGAKAGVDPAYAGELVRAAHDEEESAAFDVMVMGSDREMCEALAPIVKEYITNLMSNLSSEYQGYSLVAVSEGFSFAANDDLRVLDQQVTNDLANTRYSWVNLTTSMTDGQKKYYTAAIDMADEVSSEEAADGNPAVQTQQSLPTISYLHKKLTLIGFVGGGFIICLFIVMLYILIPVVRVKENITEGFSQPVLGTVWALESSKAFLGGIDKWLTRIFYGRESSFEVEKRVEMLCASLRIRLQKEEIGDLYITGASDKNKDLVKAICKGMGKDIKVSSGGSVVYDEKSLQQLSASKAVLFVETAGDSRFDEIQKELELAKQSKVNVMGYVLVIRD